VQGAEFIVADEPIASLDPSSARRVMDILAELNQMDGITVLVSLHQVEYALRYCPRTIALKKGEIVYDGPSSALTPELLRAIYEAEADDLFASIEANPVSLQHGVNGKRSGAEAAAKETGAVFDFSSWPRPDRRRELH
jgi:phosphonate transport system ATP-binding protein